jgi:hypothetical protein
MVGDAGLWDIAADGAVVIVGTSCPFFFFIMSTVAPMMTARISTPPTAIPAVTPGVKTDEAAVEDEAEQVWPAHGDCPAAQPHVPDPPTPWVEEGGFEPEGVIEGIPEGVLEGVLEAVAPTDNVVVGVFEVDGVGDAVAEFDGVGVLEREAPIEFVDVAEADSVAVVVVVDVWVDVRDDVGVLVAELDAAAVAVVEGVDDDEGR